VLASKNVLQRTKITIYELKLRTFEITQKYQIRTNQSILELYKGPGIVKEIKARRLQEQAMCKDSLTHRW